MNSTDSKWPGSLHGHVFSIYLGKIPLAQRMSVLRHLAESQKKIVPMTVDNSRIVPMTVEE